MKRLNRILEVTDAFAEEVAALKLPRLSSAYSALAGPELHSSLVSHRIVSQYEVPNEGAAQLRKEISIDEVLAHDKRDFQFNYRELPSDVRKDFLYAKAWLADLFKDFRKTYVLRFPTGETSLSSHGRTDLFYKLRDPKYWIVSPDLVDYSVEIVLRNRALLAVLKQHYRDLHGAKGQYVLRRLAAYHLERGASKYQIRRNAVWHMFRRVVTLDRTSRVTVVPKNNKRDRVITCEALWTMICQLSFASDLRDHLLDRKGIDLRFLQNVHRSKIMTGDATIDLSKASDSNLMVVLQQLWPERRFADLQRLRTGIFDVDGELIPLNMFAPMGCGCTFEVMTITLLAHCRVLDSGSSVFGDDIIIKTEMADRLMRNLELQGWVINVDKSFTEGNFRESCGGFADLVTGKHLLTYDLPRPASMAEVYTFSHKLLQIGQALAPCALRDVILSTYSKLLKVVPRDSWAPTTDWEYTTNSLTETSFYVDAFWLWSQQKEKLTKPVKAGDAVPAARDLVSQYWSRPLRIQVVRKTVIKRSDQRRDDVNRFFYACYMRRGQVYGLPRGETEAMVRVDQWTGTVLNTVPLVDVIPMKKTV